MRAMVRPAIAAATIAVLIALVAAAPWPASGYRHTDFFQFWAAPQALLAGASPYDHDWYSSFAATVGSRALEFWPPGWVSPYPVWTDLLTLPLALLPYRVAAATWLVALFAAMAGGLAVLAARAYRIGRVRDALVLGAVTIGFEPFWGVIGGGNIAGLALGAAALATALALAGRTLAAGACLGLLLMKPQLAVTVVPAFLLVAPRAQLRSLILGLLGSAGVLLVLSLAARPAWPLEWAESALVERMSAESNASVWTVDRLLPADLAGPLIPLIAALVVATIAGAWYRAARPPFTTALAGALALALFLAPHARHYDQVVLLVSVALILPRLGELSPAVRVPALGVIVSALVVIPWVLYGIAVSRGVTRAVPDLHEEWSALTPLIVLVLALGIDLVARRRALRLVASPAAS
jgi:hypothetical protein